MSGKKRLCDAIALVVHRFSTVKKRNVENLARRENTDWPMDFIGQSVFL